MKRFILCATIFSTLALAGNAMADSGPQVSDPPPRFRYLGVDFGAGIPSGGYLGLVLRPSLGWMRVSLDATYNGLGPGMKAGLTLDPIRFPIAPTLTVDEGFSLSGQVPGGSNQPSIGYEYSDVLLGLETGNRDKARFYLRGGFSWLNLHTDNFQQVIGNPVPGVGVGNASFQGWIFPSIQIGATILF
jgi:hypothetical protein